MRFGCWRAGVVLLLFAASIMATAGCGPADNKAAQGKDKRTKNKEQTAQAAQAKRDEHSGWWCDEHGVPEEVCGQCNIKVAAEFKKKGDWCKEHDRPDSQCFICHPELKEKFADQYRAKYGKEPPPIEEEKKGAGAEKDEPKK